MVTSFKLHHLEDDFGKNQPVPPKPNRSNCASELTTEIDELLIINLEKARRISYLLMGGQSDSNQEWPKPDSLMGELHMEKLILKSLKDELDLILECLIPMDIPVCDPR